MKCVLKFYDGCKYYDDSSCVETKILDGVTRWKVEEIEDDAIFEVYGGDECDEFSEYLFIFFDNGNVARYNNSEVDLFRYWEVSYGLIDILETAEKYKTESEERNDRSNFKRRHKNKKI